jgi:methionine synthase I (cobalamin-dependent)
VSVSPPLPPRRQSEARPLAPSPREPSRGRLLEAIGRGPLLGDSAMGTRLIARGLVLDRDDPALWNQTHPADVAELHDRDVAAGSDVLLTNTFGANRAWLNRYGQGHAALEINRRAVELARRAAGTRRFVLGDIGPSAAELAGAAAEQAAALVAHGVDGLLLETFGPERVLPVLAEVADAVKCAIPIIVSLWDWPELLAPLANRLCDEGASVLGLNCRVGIEAAIAFAEQISAAESCPILLKPGAKSGGATTDVTPAAFGLLFERLAGRNVCFFGGCCGTTEAHIAALAAARERWRFSLNDSAPGASIPRA